MQREDKYVEDYFSFEMTPEPLALFKDGFMRKPDKPALRKVLMSDNDATIGIDQLNNSAMFAIDGGALLHRVRWVKNSTFEELVQQYVNYTIIHYELCCFLLVITKIQLKAVNC